MTDDLLARATSALRDEGAPSLDDLAETRARLLTSTHVGQARKLRAVRWVLPLAAAFAAGTAFAATGSLDLVVRTVRDWVSEPSAQEAEAPRSRHAHKPKAPGREPAHVEPSEAPQAEPVLAAEPALDAPALADEFAPAQEPAPALVEATPTLEQEAPQRSAETTPAAHKRAKQARRAAGKAQLPQLAPLLEPEPAPQAVQEVEAAKAAQASPDLALYRAAHRAHFKSRDAKAALAQWDAYLARFPDGMFALEARYNRALCLLRLERREEAARALTPFAQGQVAGGYRRAEARALLEALKQPLTPKR